MPLQSLQGLALEEEGVCGLITQWFRVSLSATVCLVVTKHCLVLLNGPSRPFTMSQTSGDCLLCLCLHVAFYGRAIQHCNNNGRYLF